jgi:hypothetical protein
MTAPEACFLRDGLDRLNCIPHITAESDYDLRIENKNLLASVFVGPPSTRILPSQPAVRD